MQVTGGVDRSDPWCWSRLPVDEFNLHYEEVFIPGSLTGPDESMVPWEGEEGDQRQQIPHAHFVPRKPKDTGAELNTQADGQCGGIYRLDIERGASDTYPRQYQEEWGYTTGLNFRLAHTILDSGRIYAGDSRFMGVDQIEDLHLKGLYGIGDVKTRTSRYPVNKVKELCGTAPGDWSVMSTTLDDGFKVYAIGHRRGGEVHTFVASCGLTTAGDAQRYREDLSVYGSAPPRKCPKVLNLWSRQQPKIDKNNRFRQDILAIEERFVTRSFPFRMQTTVLGITLANAFEWFNYFINNKRYASFIDFVRDLAYDAMNNNIDRSANESAGIEPETPNKRKPGPRAAGDKSPVRMSPRQITKAHRPVPLKSIAKYQGSRTQMCAVCQDNNHKTSWCCLACSDARGIFAIHPPTVKYGLRTYQYNCLEQHHKDPHNKEHQHNIAIPSNRKGSSSSKPGRKRRRPDAKSGYESDESAML